MKRRLSTLLPVILIIISLFGTAVFSPVYAESEPPLDPTEEVAPPAEEPPAPTEEAAPPTEEAPAPTEEAAPPVEETPAPPEEIVPEETPQPEGGELPPEEQSPSPSEEVAPPEETPAPEEGGEPQDGGASLMSFMVLGAPPVPGGGGQNGTTLTAYKSASGYWTRTWSWSIFKSANPTSLTLYDGDSGPSTYTVSVTKDSYVDAFWVDGSICVTNGGAVTTENLTLTDQVQYKTGAGQFMDLPGASQVLTPAQLAPGETGCYSYSIPFTPVAGAVYRNTVKITITNHSGHLGELWGPEPKADFALPEAPIEINASVNVDDTNGGTWLFTASGSVTYDKIFTCGADGGEHLNTATIRETGQSATASVLVTCIPINTGCSLTIGYWKTHAGFGPQPDVVTPFLPITLGTGSGKSVVVGNAAFAVQILSYGLGDASNGITKLYAQLLAAKLNIANGANGSAIAGTISSADAFLALKNYNDWAKLGKNDRNMVLGWMAMLDAYNNGLIGPGHCGY